MGTVTVLLFGPRSATCLAAVVATFMIAAPAMAQHAGSDAHHGHHDSAGVSGPAGATSDSAFAAVQARGKVAMGVDQYTSTHVFQPLADGGRIELQRDAADSAGVAAIRAHMREIARAFATGNFSTPGFVHARNVPGTKVMASKRGAISYAARDLPGGAELRITTRDPEAVRAVHEFLAFQNSDHRTGLGGDRRPR